MKTCVLYQRQSSGTSDPKESLSIQVQEAECRKLAEKNGLEILGSFSDADLTGRAYPEGFEAIASIDSI